MASSLSRRFSNSEMSAPDTNARSPAPASTMARTCGSASKAATIFGTAAHMSSDTALSFSGWLKIIQPIPPSVRAIILLVPSSTSWSPRGLLRAFPLPACGERENGSNHLAAAQVGDGVWTVAEVGQDRVGVLAESGRRAVDDGGRARERHRLGDDPHFPPLW